MNGVILIDKPSGRTSYDMVEMVKRITGFKKVGHTGTLDPLATGVLPVCINEATKLVQFLILNQKEYRASLLLGVETDTFDIEGRVIARHEPVVTECEIRNALDSMVGKIEQQPPRYSAIKYKGKPMYKWARAGFQFELPTRSVEIYGIQNINIDLPYVTFDVSCSKGTYIRSLCHDIGVKLGCPACLAGLRRTRSGHFYEHQAISITAWDVQEACDIMKNSLISMTKALPDIPAITLKQDLANKIKVGYQPKLDELVTDPSNILWSPIVKLLTDPDHLLAIARLPDVQAEKDPNLHSGIKILRVFNN